MSNITYKVLEQFNNDLYILNDKQLKKFLKNWDVLVMFYFFSDKLKISLEGLNEIQIKNIIILYESFKKKE